MDQMALINRLESLEGIVEKYTDLSDVSGLLVREYSVSTSEKTREEIAEIENSDRLLQIGIVGRVKAGKSSLLNALLFNGKSVLPKAATPMTAALTVISYGKKLSAEVEFFSEQDIADIKRKHEEYKIEYDRVLNLKKKEVEERNKKKVGLKKSGIDAFDMEKLERRVKRELDKNEPVLSASYDQYERIKKSGIDLESIEKSKVVPFSSIDSLAEELGEYVGSSGRYMPFTKSVHIRIPLESLKNIQIVDTPGVNDPVSSREERTRELLKFCDVVFIVSPAGQFMSSEDLELMDRITAKEGVRELFVVASKCDMQLYGSVKQDSDGDLHKALDSITTDLASSLHETLSNLKKSNPEVGNAYDKLIEQSKDSIIHSSGISLTIKEAYDDLSVLDSGEAHAWNMLIENYPDYFSDTNKRLTIPNLDLLSNMDAMHTIVSEVRKKKDEILSKRKEEYLKAKSDSFEKYKNGLIRFINERVDELNNGDIDDLREKREKLEYIASTVSNFIDYKYKDLVDDLYYDMHSKLRNNLEQYFNEIRRDINNAEGSETKSEKVSTSKFWNPFSWGSYKTETKEITTVRAGAVSSALYDLTESIEGSVKSLSMEIMHAWKKRLPSVLITELRNNVEDEDIDPNNIRYAIGSVVRRVDSPGISYSSNSIPSGSGVLKKGAAERFLNEARKYVSSMKARVNKDIDSYLNDLSDSLRAINISQEIFSEYESKMKKLEEEIERKEVYLDMYNRMKKGISEV